MNFFDKIKASCLHLGIFLLSIPLSSQASDFNIPFVNVSDLGSLYSGWAVTANDASTSYTNPAGLIKLKNPQIVGAAMAVIGHTEFSGTTTNTLGQPETGTASGSLGGFLPLFYAAAPLSDKIVVGFGINAPFGLSTGYSKTSIVRYAATRSQILAVDVEPSIGFKLSDTLSIGVGLDAQRLTFTLNNMYGPPFSVPDAEGQNHLAGWGYGVHAGVLYQPLPATHIGLSYNSQVMCHTSGDSEVFMPTGNEIRTTTQKASMALPTRAQVSVAQDVTAKLTAMATVFYTHWSTLNQLTMQHTVLPTGTIGSVTVPFQYHDTFDYSLGLNFKANEKWILRTGMQYFNSPSTVRNRSVVDPVSYMFLLGVGAHYKQNAHVSYDIGYAHDFFRQTPIRLSTPLTTAMGHSNSSSDIVGAQVTWDI